MIKWIVDRFRWILYYRPRDVDQYYDENYNGSKKKKHKKNKKNKNKNFSY